tara:strand:- start:756 stop:1115 length:360 start_codon:yes stop_codon:yes gene_type:complete
MSDLRVKVLADLLKRLHLLGAEYVVKAADGDEFTNCNGTLKAAPDPKYGERARLAQAALANMQVMEQRELAPFAGYTLQQTAQSVSSEGCHIFGKGNYTLRTNKEAGTVSVLRTYAEEV